MTTTNLESSYEAALQAKEATESKVMSAIFANDTDGINKYRKDLEGYKQTVAELKNSIENSAKEESYQKQVEQKKEEERQDSIEKALRFLDTDEKPKAQPQVTVAIPTSLSNVKSTVDSGSTEPQKPAVKSASSSSEANT
jgi:hypothetical protein